jgi:hypothetical protein
MWNVPSKKILDNIPRLYETEEIPLADKIIHMHFFIGGCDWFVAEFDSEDLIFWGFVNLNDVQNAEWGYFGLQDLKSYNIRGVEIDFDLYWKVRPAKEVPLIKCY